MRSSRRLAEFRKPAYSITSSSGQPLLRWRSIAAAIALITLCPPLLHSLLHLVKFLCLVLVQRAFDLAHGVFVDLLHLRPVVLARGAVIGTQRFHLFLLVLVNRKYFALLIIGEVEGLRQVLGAIFRAHHATTAVVLWRRRRLVLLRPGNNRGKHKRKH